MKKLIQHTIIGLAVTTSIYGCSSGNGGSTAASNVSYIASIDFYDPEVNNVLELDAIFTKAQTPVPVSEVLAELSINVQEDTCKIITENGEGDDAAGLQIGDVSLESVSAGEIITVSGPSGSIAEMPRTLTFGLTVYEANVELTDETASGLMIDVPGDEFPAFSTLTIPNIVPFVLTSEPPASAEISSAFTWQPNPDSNSRIKLYTNLEDSTLDTEGVEVVRRVEIDCFLLDDGSFTFSAADQAQISAAGFSELPMYIGREVVSYRQEGDALIAITRASGDL